MIRSHLLVFVIFNIFLYWFADFYADRILFNEYNHLYAANRFLTDPRVENKSANLFQKLAVWDAQWNLKVAADGYPKHPVLPKKEEKTQMGGALYAFYPAYPLLIKAIQMSIGDLLISAFVLTFVLLAVGFLSLAAVVGRVMGIGTGIKTAWLMFLFPASIFWRSYYADGLVLLPVIWFGYFLYKKNFNLAAILLGFINLTKGRLYLLNLVWLGVIVSALIKKEMTIMQAIKKMALLVLMFLPWPVFNYMQTGDAFYFVKTVKFWYEVPVWKSLIYNFGWVLNFLNLPLHGFHFSKIEVVTVFIFGFLLIKSRRMLPEIWWWMAVAIFVGPLLVRDLTSFTRYQAINFPIFVYLAKQLSGSGYKTLLGISTLGLLWTSLLLFNWYWIG